VASIVLIVALTVFYTFEGGMTAVIWTDVVQMCLYVAGAVVSLAAILGKIPGGWQHAAAVAGAAHKFAIFDFRFTPTMEFFSRPYTFWAGIAGGCFLTTASHGTDQLMVQRLLSARNQADSRKALLASWVLVAFQFTLFLLIGVLLWVYYGAASRSVPAPDRIYPQFIWNSLPPGLAGVVIAAILAAAMANLSAALNAISSTVVVDFLRGGSGPSGEAGAMRRARLATLAWAAILVAIGYAGRHSRSVLEAGLTIASIPSGALLGVFLLGVLTRRPGERAAIAGVVAGLVAALAVHFATPVAYTWYVMIGATVTFAVGLAASWLGRALAKIR
jgi:Na+/proline symporter